MGLLNWLKRKPTPEPAPAPEPEKPKFGFVHFNLAGVTHETDGASRQTLIRKIKLGKPPFEDQAAAQVGFNETSFNGEPAVECVVNGIMIGWVPKNKIADVLHAMDQPGCKVLDFEVIGGKTVNGERLNYGVEVTLRYDNL